MKMYFLLNMVIFQHAMLGTTRGYIRDFHYKDPYSNNAYLCRPPWRYKFVLLGFDEDEAKRLFKAGPELGVVGLRGLGYCE